jgi:hypothetical protein
MINDLKTAKYVSDLVSGVNAQLADSVQNVRNASAPEEFEVYQRRVGTLVYSIFEQILVPIYKKHPSLKPPELEI